MKKLISSSDLLYWKEHYQILTWAGTIVPSCLLRQPITVQGLAHLACSWSKPYNKWYYYSFKIFPCFWLVKTTCLIHHNQLLLTKFRKNFVILNWHQKFVILNQLHQNDVKSSVCCRLLNHRLRKPGDVVVLCWWAEKQRVKWQTPLTL